MGKFLFNPLSGQLDQSGGTTLTVGTTTGTVAAGDDSRLSDSRTPTAHSSTHHTGGTDSIAPNNISAQWELVVSTLSIAGDTVLTSGRNRRITLLKNPGPEIWTITLPYVGQQFNDILTLVTSSLFTGELIIRRAGRIENGVPEAYTTLATFNGPNQSFTFTTGFDTTTWNLQLVDSHDAGRIYNSTTAGRALLTADSVQAQRDALDVFVGVANFAALPTPGVTVSAGGSVYVTNNNGRVWVWNGSAYTEISPNTHTRAGSNNTFVNDTALASAVLSGANNTAVGTNALSACSSGAQNTAIGTTALQYNATASYNTGIGFEAMSANAVTGSFNTGVGIQACKSNSSGFQNTAVGAGSLRDNQAGLNNTAVGFTALISAAGNRNTAVGSQAGDAVSVGEDNTIVGSSADVDSADRSRCVVLGSGATSPPENGSLAIGGTGWQAMDSLTTSTAPTGATSYLRVWLNGLEYRILIQRP